MITFDNGETYEDFTCNCCCGCNGTFPFRWLISAVLRDGVPEDAMFPYGIYHENEPSLAWFETGIFPSGVLEFSDMNEFFEFVYPEEDDFEEE